MPELEHIPKGPYANPRVGEPGFRHIPKEPGPFKLKRNITFERVLQWPISSGPLIGAGSRSVKPRFTETPNVEEDEIV